MGGGTFYAVPELHRICDQAHERGLKVHIDGARIFNASAASGISVDCIASKADTVMFCLSKALGAPVGSVLAGTAEAMSQARVHRKQLGGGMRQAGVLAAAGLIALEEMPRRLSEDHATARLLAEGIAEIPGISIEPANVVTNIVIFDVAGTGTSPADLISKAKSRGVLVSGIGGTRIRLVTHYDVTREDCVEALGALKQILT
jgi:threonine aldolase